MKHVLKDKDGKVLVMTLAKGSKVEEVLEAIKVDQPDIEHQPEVDANDLPDKDFRDEWEIKGKNVKVNLPKARKRMLKKLRLERDELLKATDAEYSQALSIAGSFTDPEVKKVEKKKKKLRDLPILAEAQLKKITKLDELKAFKVASVKDEE